MVHRPTTPPRLVTVPSRRLSLWQSAAEQTVRERLGAAGAAGGRALLLAHPLVEAVNRHVAAENRGEKLAPPGEPGTGAASPAYLSMLHLRHAEAVRNVDTVEQSAIEAQFRYYSDQDYLGWASCETTYLAYTPSPPEVQYRDWQVQGGGNLDYSLIDYQLPDDATVAIIGDWGTGMNDAESLLMEVVGRHQPQAIIHLGDIYYSGTPQECMLNFTAVVQNVFNVFGVNLPVFTIPGNHDYYDWGSGFYGLIDTINASNPAWRQDASYFCLRTQDGLWQFLGMDTGQDDSDPIDEVHPAQGPVLRSSECTWHQDKLNPAKFDGTTILLSHHQVFSTHETINNDPDLKPYLNASLLDVFQPHLGQVAGWFWGHEHNLALFQDGLFGVAKGRLLGSSAYEESQGDDPYEVVYAEVPYQPYGGQTVELGMVDEYYNHSYAIVDLSRAEPTDPVSVAYYQIPSWGGEQSTSLPPGQKWQLATEELS